MEVRSKRRVKGKLFKDYELSIYVKAIFECKHCFYKFEEEEADLGVNFICPKCKEETYIGEILLGRFIKMIEDGRR